MHFHKIQWFVRWYKNEEKEEKLINRMLFS